MTTITEILAEAFNRVKAEHDVTLSRVEYVDTGGVLVLNFKAASTAKGTPLVVHRVVPQSAPYHVYSKAEFKPHTVDPNDCTHVGSVDVYDDCYWKFEAGNLYLWDGSGTWNHYDSGESAQRTVDSQLRALANPS